MNVYDLVEKKSLEIAGVISAVLGLCITACSCWLLQATLHSESVAYFSYGLKVGALKYEEQNETEAYDLLTTKLYPYVLILKLSSSLGILSGILTIGTSTLVFQNRSKNILKLWLILTLIAILISIAAFILPLSYEVVRSIEMKIFVTVTGVTTFILLHLLVVVFIQFRSKILQEENEKKALDPSQILSTPDTNNTTVNSTIPQTNNRVTTIA